MQCPNQDHSDGHELPLPEGFEGDEAVVEEAALTTVESVVGVALVLCTVADPDPDPLPPPPAEQKLAASALGYT